MTSLAPTSLTTTQQSAEFPPDVFALQEQERAEPDVPPEEIPYSRLMTAIKACVPLIALAAVGAVIIAFAILGSHLMFLGFAVAFLLIMFIGMPLMMASITDALEEQPSH